MKNLLLIFTLLFTSVFFSSPSYAGWTKVDEGTGSGNRGTIFYVDFERIRKHDGFVYFWKLMDYLKLTKQGHLSSKIYSQGDCKSFRWKDLSFIPYKEPMGGGTAGRTFTPPDKWMYPVSYSMDETALKSVCNR